MPQRCNLQCVKKVACLLSNLEVGAIFSKGEQGVYTQKAGILMTESFIELIINGLMFSVLAVC